MKELKESDLVRWCLEYLWRKGYYVWRNNTGAQKIESKTGSRFFRFGKKGSSDILGIHKDGTGRLLAIECKVGSNKVSPEQTEFLETINKNGGVAIVCYKPEDVMLVL